MAPTPLDKERSHNFDLLNKLRELGDHAEVVRPVDFGALFPSDQLREAFLTEAAQNGYRLGQSGKWVPEGTSECWCEITLETSIEDNVIAGRCLEIRTLAQRFAGEFDGWATSVMRG